MDNNQIQDSVLEKYYSTIDTIKSKDGKVILSFIGNVNSDLITSSTYLLENYFNINFPFSKLKNKIIISCIEIIQNIMENSPKEDEIKQNSFIVVGHVGEDIILQSFNLCEKENYNRLKEYIKDIESKSKAKLETLYKKNLKDYSMSKAKSGLGLYTVAINSTTKPIFEIAAITDNYYSVNITITIKNE
jgi:hypothetical protein